MNRWLKSQYRIPSFKGARTFKPLQAEQGEELPGEATDPTLLPEEQATIKRYLRYADTLIKSSESDASESQGQETHGSETHGSETHGPKTDGLEAHRPKRHGSQSDSSQTHDPATHGPQTHGPATTSSRTSSDEMRSKDKGKAA